jgi:hypothetical protein
MTCGLSQIGVYEMANTYDVTLTVNVTLEYDEPQTQEDVEVDARDSFEYLDTYSNGAHIWVCDAEAGSASVIDGSFAEEDE